MDSGIEITPIDWHVPFESLSEGLHHAILDGANAARAMLAPACQEMAGTTLESHPTSRIFAHLHHQADTSAVDTLFGSIPESGIGTDFPYTAELMVLANHPRAIDAERTKWTSRLLDPDIRDHISDTELATLSEVFGKAGRLSFSFPTWRFLAQQHAFRDVTVAALLESWGMSRLRRSSDRECDGQGNEADRLGSSYVSTPLSEEAIEAPPCRHGTAAPIYVDYRRANLQVLDTEHGGIVTVRNSSYFFGRDRFIAPVYFSPDLFSVQTGQALTEIDLDHGQRLLPLNHSALFDGTVGLSAESNIAMMSSLVDSLAAFENRLGRWLFDSEALKTATGDFGVHLTETSPGYEHLLAALTVRELNARVAANGDELEYEKRVPILGFVDHDMPQWFPYAVLKVGHYELHGLIEAGRCKSLEDLNSHHPEIVKFLSLGLEHRAKLVWLSGTKGDFPIW